MAFYIFAPTRGSADRPGPSVSLIFRQLSCHQASCQWWRAQPCRAALPSCQCVASSFPRSLSLPLLCAKLAQAYPFSPVDLIFLPTCSSSLVKHLHPPPQAATPERLCPSQPIPEDQKSSAQLPRHLAELRARRNELPTLPEACHRWSSLLAYSSASLIFLAAPSTPETLHAPPATASTAPSHRSLGSSSAGDKLGQPELQGEASPSLGSLGISWALLQHLDRSPTLTHEPTNRLILGSIPRLAGSTPKFCFKVETDGWGPSVRDKI